jgi:hypothetical protein
MCKGANVYILFLLSVTTFRVVFLYIKLMNIPESVDGECIIIGPMTRKNIYKITVRNLRDGMAPNHKCRSLADPLLLNQLSSSVILLGYDL